MLKKANGFVWLNEPKKLSYTPQMGSEAFGFRTF